MSQLLLDTHAAMWFCIEANDLGRRADSAIRGANVVKFSAITPWELSVKRSSGKLRFDVDLVGSLIAAGFEELPISARHGERAGSLPLHHRDPFDRMLIAQAQMERLTIVTADRVFSEYDVDVLDAEL